MNCTLTANQQKSFYKKVYKDFLNLASTDQPLDIKEYITGLYNIISERTNDPALALSYAQLVPENIILSTAQNRNISKFLSKLKKLDELGTLRSDFEEDIKAVENYVAPKPPTEAEIKNINSTVATYPGGQTAAATEDKVIQAKTLDILSTTNQEEQKVDGELSGRETSDERVLASFNLNRYILNRLENNDKETTENITVLEGTGIFLTPVTMSQINLPAQPGKDYIVLAYTTKVDNEYKFIYTDKEGNPIALEGEEEIPEDAILPYTNYRFPKYSRKTGKFENPTVLSARERVERQFKNTDITKEAKERVIKDTEKVDQDKYKFINNLTKYIRQNPGLRIGLPITGGSQGFNLTNFSRQVNLSEINNLPESFTIETIKDPSSNLNGLSFLKLDKFYNSLKVNSQKISNPETIARFLTDTKVNAIKRANVIKNLMNSSRVKVLVEDEKLVILNEGQEIYRDGGNIGYTNIEQSELEELIGNQYYNINSDLIDTNIELPEYAENKVVYSSVPYRSYLKQNTYVNAALRNNGDLRTFNSKLNFTTVNYTKEILESDEQVQAVKTTPKKSKEIYKPNEGVSFGDVSVNINKDLINKINDSLKRAGKPTVSMSEAEIKKAKNWYKGLTVEVDGKSRKLFDLLPFNEAFALANSDVLGEFTVDGITVYTQAGNKDYSTLYHEAWHGFSQLLLTKEQKKQLYDETRKLVPSLKNASDRKVEEHLAEDFRDYMMKKGSSIVKGKTRKNIFQRILDLLKALFKGYSYQSVIENPTGVDLISKMYDNLSKGQLFEYKYSLDNVQFGNLNRGVQKLDSKYEYDLSLSDSLEINNAVDYLISEISTAAGIEIATLYTSKDSLNLLYNAVKDNFIQRLSEFDNYVEGKDPSTVQPQLHAIKLLEYAIDNFGDFDKVLSGEQTSGVIYYHREKSKYLTLDNKFFKDDLELNKDDLKNSDFLERTGNQFSLKDTSSNQVLYMIKSLIDKGTEEQQVLGYPKLVDFNDAFNKISQALVGSTTFADITDRLAKLAAEYEPAAQLIVKLGDFNNITNQSTYNKWNAFLKTFDKTFIPIMELIVSQDTQGEKTINTIVSRATSDINKTKETFLNRFQSKRNSPYITSTVSGNILNTKKIVEDFSSINKNNLFDFVNAIGIYLDDTPVIRKELNGLFNKTPREGGITFSYLLNEVKEINKEGLVVNDPIKALRKRKQSTSINKLLTLQVMYGKGKFNAGVQNAEGNVEYEVSERFSLSNMVDDLNALTNLNEILTNKKYEHLKAFHPDNNPYSKYSVLMQSLFDFTTGNKKEGAQLLLDNLSGAKRIDDGVTKKGIKTNKLNEYDKLTTDLHNLFLRGMPELPRHASKSSAYALGVNYMASPLGAGKLYVPISKVMESDTYGVSESMPLLLDYLAAELGRIMVVSQDDFFKTIDTLDKKGKEITVFDLLINNKTKKELVKFAKNAKSLDEIREKLNDDSIKSKLQENFISYFAGLYNEYIEKYFEIGYISKDLQEAVIKEGLTDRSKVSEVLVNTYLLNNFANNFELQLFYGDYSQFNESKEEFHKRNASVASTGVFPTIDDPSIEFINSDISNSYAAKSDKEAKPFSNKFTSVVFSDTEVKSVYYDYYKSVAEKYLKDNNFTGDINKEVSKLLKPYENMEEGDAQGWINFDSYRNFMLSINKWSTEQESLYKDIAAGKQVDSASLTTTFPVIKASYYGPIVTEKLNVTALHKFSLAPLIPTVVKGTNMEKLLDRMIDEGIDYGLYKSGSKISNVTLEDGVIPGLYSDKNTRTLYEGPLPKTEVYLKYLKNQLDINPQFKGKTSLSTQMRKLVLTNLFENGKAKKPEYKKLAEKYEKSLQEYVDFLKVKLFKEAGVEITEDGSVKPGDKSKLISAIKKEFIRRDIPDHQMDILNQNEDGTLSDNLDNSINSSQIETLLVSIIERKIIKAKVNGEQLVQVSGSGFETSEFTKPTKEEVLKYGTDGLAFYRVENGKTQPMQVKVALQGQFKKLLYATHPDGNKIMTLDRLNEAIKDENWMNTNRKSLEMAAVRIPVQGLNSMEYMTVAEFLPEEAGSIVILPSEIVAKTGSDFDIDKLSVIMPNISISKITQEDSNALVFLYGEELADTFLNESIADLSSDERKIQNFENNILTSITDILSLEDNFFDLIRPNDVSLVKGLADSLAKVNREYKVVRSEKQDPFQNREVYEKMSPTRATEPLYNLYKHSSNNVGKVTLGIGAISNTYNIILNRVGAFLNRDHVVYNSKNQPQVRETEILLPHNKVDNKISLSNEFDAQGINKIQDIISQLINGWVDIEKDAWVFDINAVYELTPTFLFLLQTGVSLEDASMLISQPLVREYIKELRKEDSLFKSVLSEDNSNLPASYRAKKNIITKYQINIGKKAGSKHAIYTDYSEIKKNTNPENLKPQVFSNKLKNLTEGTLNDKDFSALAFMHFLYLEEMAKSMRKITSATNVDTSRVGNLFEAQNKMSTLQEASADSLISPGVIDRIEKSSPIAPFFIQDYIINMYKDLFPIRANEKLNGYLVDYVKENYFKITEKGPDQVEKFVRDFRNDFISFIFQNTVGQINLDDLTSYKGFDVSSNTKEVPVEKVSGLKRGVLFYNGKLYVDKNTLYMQYQNKTWNTQKYNKLGLYKLPDINNPLVSLFPAFKTYTAFVLEREYLRSIRNRQADQSQVEYEKELAEEALKNTFNLASSFFGYNTYADELLDIKENYPELVNKYKLLDNLQYEETEIRKNKNVLGRIKNIRLDGNIKDVDFVSSMNEQLEELSDPTVMKVKDKEENKRLSKYFENLNIFAFLQSGMNPSRLSFTSIVSNSKFKQLMKEPIDKYVKNMKPSIFNLYASKFEKENAKQTGYRFKNYIVENAFYSAQQKVLFTEKESDNILPENTEFDYFVYTPSRFIAASRRKDFSVNPQIVVVYNKAVSEEPSFSGINMSNNKAYLGNPKFGLTNMGVTSFGIASGENLTSISEVQQDQAIAKIDKDISNLIEAKNNGKTIALDETGYGVLSKNPQENKALLHLSKKLFDEFKYINPVLQKNGEFMSYVFSSQPLNEVVIDEDQDIAPECGLGGIM